MWLKCILASQILLCIEHGKELPDLCYVPITVKSKLLLEICDINFENPPLTCKRVPAVLYLFMCNFMYTQVYVCIRRI